MSRPHRIRAALALGAMVNSALAAAWLGALVAWARRCESRRRHA